MRSVLLSTQILLASGLTLLLFSAAVFWVLYQAQSKLAVQEMDTLLENEAFALSALVNARPNGNLDFEISEFFLAQYRKTKSQSFFRLFPRDGASLLRESPRAPRISCQASRQVASIQSAQENKVYRVISYLFQPEIDEDVEVSAPFARPWLCLVVGLDETPYRALVVRTIFATAPILVGILFCSLLLLLVLVRTLTSDLSRLADELATADFGATHAFPGLPEARTPEVKAVIEKLEIIHEQAAHVYQEMWFFLGRAAHQLKTPVTAIQATIEVLLRRDRAKEDLLSGLSDIEVGVRQMSRLTQKLIASSRIEYQPSLEVGEVDLQGFFSEQIQLFRSQADKRGISFQIRPSPSVRVAADIHLLSELFGNLIENAVLYSREGGKILVSWDQKDAQAFVFLSDQGAGFPPQVTERLFEPFVRGDERKIPGSGLGLSIAKKASQLLGGDVFLAENTPRGSKLQVTLPAASPKS